MHAHQGLAAVTMLLIVTIGALSFAGESPRPPASPTPTIEGTYKLISRQLADGTTQRAPDIMGLLTSTKSHGNFTVIWKDATGKFFSYSLASTYQLTPTEYRETVLFSTLNDQIGGKDIVYDLSGKTPRVPVNMDGGRLQFTLPFDPPAVVFEGDTMTATAPRAGWSTCGNGCPNPRVTDTTMPRRTIGFLVTLALSLLAVSLAADGPPPMKVPRVGVLSPQHATESPTVQREPFAQGLRALGWEPAASLLTRPRPCLPMLGTFLSHGITPLIEVAIRRPGIQPPISRTTGIDVG